ncbi:hypothetical protein IOD13_01815 [Brevibacterium casei]|nr:hypothetical protein [Brevibacterium casei]
MPVFTIYPGDWFLALEDHGTSFTVRDSDGKGGRRATSKGSSAADSCAEAVDGAAGQRRTRAP